MNPKNISISLQYLIENTNENTSLIIGGPSQGECDHSGGEYLYQNIYYYNNKIFIADWWGGDIIIKINKKTPFKTEDKINKFLLEYFSEAKYIDKFYLKKPFEKLEAFDLTEKQYIKHPPEKNQRHWIEKLCLIHDKGGVGDYEVYVQYRNDSKAKTFKDTYWIRKRVDNPKDIVADLKYEDYLDVYIYNIEECEEKKVSDYGLSSYGQIQKSNKQLPKPIEL